MGAACLVLHILLGPGGSCGLRGLVCPMFSPLSLQRAQGQARGPVLWVGRNCHRLGGDKMGAAWVLWTLSPGPSDITVLWWPLALNLISMCRPSQLRRGLGPVPKVRSRWGLSGPVGVGGDQGWWSRPWDGWWHLWAMWQDQMWTLRRVTSLNIRCVDSEPVCSVASAGPSCLSFLVVANGFFQSVSLVSVQWSTKVDVQVLEGKCDKVRLSPSPLSLYLVLPSLYPQCFGLQLL